MPRDYYFYVSQAVALPEGGGGGLSLRTRLCWLREKALERTIYSLPRILLLDFLSAATDPRLQKFRNDDLELPDKLDILPSPSHPSHTPISGTAKNENTTEISSTSIHNNLPIQHLNPPKKLKNPRTLKIQTPAPHIHTRHG